jgi:hypothetical protein
MGAIVAPVSAERGSRDDPALVGALDRSTLAHPHPLPGGLREAVFDDVGRRLDAAIRSGEGLRLEVPFACWTAMRRS